MADLETTGNPCFAWSRMVRPQLFYLHQMPRGIAGCIVMVLAEFKGTRPVAVLISRTGDVGEE